MSESVRLEKMQNASEGFLSGSPIEVHEKSLVQRFWDNVLYVILGVLTLVNARETVGIQQS